MKISDLVELSAKNLSRRKGRTALTVIGVVVGTCAVVVMISLGIAQNRANEEMLKNFGDLTQISVYSSGTQASNGKTPAKLDDKTLAGFKSIAHVTAVTPQLNSWNVTGQIKEGKNGRYVADYSGCSVGLYPEAMEPLGFTLADGQWLTAAENPGKDKIPVLVCKDTAYQFADSRKSQNSSKRQRYSGQLDAAGNPVQPFFTFDGGNTPLTLTITDGASDTPRTKTYQLVVVGTLNPDPAKGWWTQNYLVFRVADMQRIQKDYKALTKATDKTVPNYGNVTVKVDDVKNVDAVDQQFKDMGFQTYSMTQQRKEMQQTVAKSQMILGGLAAISLLVAALNIANTMTMAIYERTREIGVMKVLGCELGQIRWMFLIESGFIGFIGGVVGSAISLGISLILNNITAILALFGQSGAASSLLNGGSAGGAYYGYGDAAASTVISIVPPWLLLLALCFATLIGLLSGIAPANRAVRISALEAIRHD